MNHDHHFSFRLKTNVCACGCIRHVRCCDRGLISVPRGWPFLFDRRPTSGANANALISDLSCKMFTIGSNLPLLSVSHLMSYRTVERTIAVGWPLFARRVFIEKITRQTPTVLVSSIVVAYVLHAILIGYSPQLLSGWGFRCAPTGVSVLYQVFFWYFCLTLYVSHSLTMLVSSLMMVVRLLLNATRRRGLDATIAAASVTPQSILHFREVRASLTVAEWHCCSSACTCRAPQSAWRRASRSRALTCRPPSRHSTPIWSSCTCSHKRHSLECICLHRQDSIIPSLLAFGVVKTHVHNSTSSGNH